MIDYSQYKGIPIREILARNPNGMPAGWSWEEFYNANPSDYDARTGNYDAWVAAGSPGKDKFGRLLDSRGSIVTSGFGNNPADAAGGRYSPNNFINQFAQNRPWAQGYLRDGGDLSFMHELSTITQEDYNGYDPTSQALIRQMLSQTGFRPEWMTDTTHPMGRNNPLAPPQMGREQLIPGSRPPGPNPGQNPNASSGIQRPPGQTREKSFTPQSAMSTTPTGLTGLSRSLGNTQGRSSPFSLGAFARRPPRGYQGY